VTVTSCPPVPRRKLGRWLLAMRESAGLSPAQAAKELAVSRSALDRMERGEAAVTLPLAASMMQLYDQVQPGVLELAQQAREPGWWSDHRVDNIEYLAWETCATSLHEVATTSIPELLRTEPYERAMLTARTAQIGEDDVVRRRIRDGLSARSVRQYRFAEHPVLRFHVVVTEVAVRRAVGNGQVMLTQWLHLLWAMSWAAVTLRILPAAATPPRLRGFRLLGFADPDEPARLYRDWDGHEMRVTTAAPVAEQACLRFDQLAPASLSQAESAAFVQRLIREAGIPALADVGSSA
jgi:transcriptional regulator with XRE-family HTH domain